MILRSEIAWRILHPIPTLGVAASSHLETWTFALKWPDAGDGPVPTKGSSEVSVPIPCPWRPTMLICTEMHTHTHTQVFLFPVSTGSFLCSVQAVFQPVDAHDNFRAVWMFGHINLIQCVYSPPKIFIPLSIIDSVQPRNCYPHVSTNRTGDQ